MEHAERAVADLRDPATFRALYEHMLPRVYSFVYHRCGGNVAVAEDVTQEAFLAAVREIHKGTEVHDPPGWLFGLARHKLYDHFRHEAREERTLRLVWEAEPEEGWTDEGPDPELTLAALGSMPPTQRNALVLRYLEGLSVPEVADVLERSVHATESLLARGRLTFRRAYQEAAHDR